MGVTWKDCAENYTNIMQKTERVHQKHVLQGCIRNLVFVCFQSQHWREDFWLIILPNDSFVNSDLYWLEFPYYLLCRILKLGHPLCLWHSAPAWTLCHLVHVDRQFVILSRMQSEVDLSTGQHSFISILVLIWSEQPSTIQSRWLFCISSTAPSWHSLPHLSSTPQQACTYTYYTTFPHQINPASRPWTVIFQIFLVQLWKTRAGLPHENLWLKRLCRAEYGAWSIMLTASLLQLAATFTEVIWFSPC